MQTGLLLNGEQRVALLDPGAIREVLLAQIALYPRNQFHRIGRGGVPRKRQVVGYVLDARVSDRDLGYRLRCDRMTSATEAHQHRRQVQRYGKE